MRHFGTRHVTLSVLLVVMLLGGSAVGLELEPIFPVFPSVDWTPADLSVSGTVDEDTAVIDSNIVAWEYGSEIRVKNLATGVVRTIPDSGGIQAEPDVSGDYVVYQDNGAGNWDILLYRWSTDAVTTVRATAATEEFPRVDGNFVVWWDDTNDNLWGRIYGMGGTSAVQLTNGYNNIDYDVDNGRIAIVTDANRLYVRKLLPLKAYEWIRDFTDSVVGIEMHGNRIAVSTLDIGGDHDIVVCNIEDGTVSNVATSDTLHERAASIFHNGVAWFEYETLEAESDIGYGYPGLSIVQTPGFGGVEADRYPSIYGHRIAYQRDLGGDSDVMIATSDTKWSARSSGGNRYATAAATSAAYFKSADDVVLCNGQNFPDALSAAPLAKALDAPLLLTVADALSPETATEIARLAPDKIWVIGGTSVISPAVYTQLDATYDVERVAGDDRYETSAEVARKYEELVGTSAVFKAFFACGSDYPDALAVGPVASAANGPVMLVQKDAIPASIADAVDDLDITIGYIIGGTSVVSETANTALRALITGNGAIGTITERWSGANRYETAVDVAEHGLLYRWIDLDTVGFATGLNFPDALGAGAALGSYGSPLLLTDTNALSPATATFLDDHEYEIGRVNSFGGTSVISATVYDAINAKIK